MAMRTDETKQNTPLKPTRAALEEIPAFIFTERGFMPDPADPGEGAKAWKAAPYVRLYEFSFRDLSGAKGKISASARYLYELGNRFLRDLTSIPGLELARQDARAELSEESAEALVSSVPFALGSEFVNEDWIRLIYSGLNEVYQAQIQEYTGSVKLYLAEKSQHLTVPERVFFHLVETRRESYPFAFMATYATRDKMGRMRHMPLEYALTEYKTDRDKLLKLLACLNDAADQVPLIAGFMESGELFHPLKLTMEEAYDFLLAIPEIEEAGILCRIPDWWKKKTAQVSLSVKIGEEKGSMLGFDTLLSLKPQLVVDGVPLTAEEIQELLRQTNGLANLKGKWVEVDREKLSALLEQMKESEGEITLKEVLQAEAKGGDENWEGKIISNGKWLSEIMGQMRHPESRKSLPLPETFKGELRPYQSTGYSWLTVMDAMGFGACLADDMGLGKTVQVLAYLENLRLKKPEGRALLIVPASLLGNWQKEAEKFVPEMTVQVLHGHSNAVLTESFEKSDAFLTITTYGLCLRLTCLKDRNWESVILDEAQAIKNPKTKQTRAVKAIPSRMHLVMTGTPIENDLSNLWSIFDFCDKGLLGSSAEFAQFAREIGNKPEGYARLRNMISPFLLRRLKTDRKVISDLPEKVENVEYVNLSRKQTVLYRKCIKDLSDSLERAEIAKKAGSGSGMSQMERRGLVLAVILKLKQICNHPDQYLGQEIYEPDESGKFQMLKELCETIYEKRERVLVFTQFKEITDHLMKFLEGVFHAKGYVIHGGISPSARTKIVDLFNDPENYVPFLVLSVKAAGTGLNLTAANHVVHFDRWWNPAVENQATDRAFRIGQKKNVMVHKFVCSGTVEEKIDQIINSKKELAENVIGASQGEKWITEMSNEQLMNLLRLE